jgi:aminopeptidase C
LKPIKTVKTREEKLNQNRFFFWYKKENQDWIRKQLTKAKRPDLIDKLLGDQAQTRSKTPEGKKPGVPNWLEERRKKRG